MGGAADISAVPSVFDFIRESFPPGAELVEMVAPDGRTYSGEELKAVERQESNMQQDIEKPGMDVSANIRAMLSDIKRAASGAKAPEKKPEMEIKFLFKDGDRLYMLRSDDTLWFLCGNQWLRIPEHALPAIPQEA